jgi:hypothetical protein
VGVVLRFDDDAPFAIPRVGLVRELPKEPNLVPVLLVLGFGLCLQLRRQGGEARVFAHADEVIDPVAVAPAKHLPTAKPTVRAQEDPNLGPLPPQRFNQQRQHRPGVPRPVNVAGSQVTH